MQAKNYDYIIAGGGMAGLSLAFYLNQSSLRGKRILIIDREPKEQNDHTWCFWEDQTNPFESIVYHKWKEMWFYGTNGFAEKLNLENYQYKMIRSDNFYKFIRTNISENSNITFLQTEILTVENDIVKTTDGDFFANEFIFDSFTQKTYDNPNYQNLLQHFEGWIIETKEAKFNPNEPTLFDFRIPQNNECRFVYVLPMSANKALIEFTIFSDNLLPQTEYDENLQKYIAEILKIEDFTILEKEHGVIPMSDEPHVQMPSEKTIRIGTAGGYVKPSTGYCFLRTQKHLQKLVDNLSNSRFQIPNVSTRWKSFMDSVLLNVLRTKKHPADDVFTHLFERNRAVSVLKFLDEETSLLEDYGIMRSVPQLPFIKAVIDLRGKKK